MAPSAAEPGTGDFHGVALDRLLSEAPPDEVIGHHGVREVYLGDRFTI